MSDWNAGNPYRLNMTVGRGYLLKDIDSSGKMPKARIKTAGGRDYSGLDFITPAGLAVNLKGGNKQEVLTLAPNGDPSQMVVLPIGDRESFYKPKDGGVALYSPANKANVIEAHKEGLDLKSPDKPLSVNTKDFKFENGVLDLFEGKIKFENGKIVFKCDFEIEGVAKINGVIQIGD